MTMTKPSQDAERLETVQRTARYVLSRSTVGQTRFAAMEVFPPDLPHPKSGTPEYAWRQQLAWTWSKAGFLHEALAGTGLQKRRIYTMLQAGREALERIAADPALASFYIANKRTGPEAANRPVEFFRPPELVRVMTATDRTRRIVSASPDDEDALPSKGLRLVSPSAEDVPEESPAAREGSSGGSFEGVQEMIAELRGLPIFFERITSVLERMNERLVKVEGATKAQSTLFIEALKMPVEEVSEENKPVTRDEVATALAEMTQSFLRDNPQTIAIAASLKKHEESHLQLAGEIAKAVAPTIREIVSRDIKPGLSQKIDERLAAFETKVLEDVGVPLVTLANKDVSINEVTLAGRVAALVIAEISRAVSKEMKAIPNLYTGLMPAIEGVVAHEHAETEKRLLAHTNTLALSGKKDLEEMQQALETGVSTIVTNAVTSAVDGRVATDVATITKIIDQRLEALSSSVESRLSKLAPDVGAVRKLSEKLEGEITATCETLKEDLASVSADAQDLAERVENVVESFDAGHAEFKRQGEIVVANFKSVSGAAESVLDAAHAVAKEIILLARLRAVKDGATLEETFDAASAAITRVAEAEVRLIGASTALGGGLIKQTGAPMKPIIVPAKEEQKEDKS